MRVHGLLLSLLALLSQASATTMRDFRVRGYMQYTNTLGSAACDSQSIAACAKAGRLGLRSSGDTLQLLPPAPGWAMLNGTMVGCPEAFAAISTDASGDNQQATGVFKADAGQPLRQPTTPFVVTPGGTANTLQIRTLTIDCIYQFTLTEATSYILGVQPQAWVSVFKRASAATARALSPAALLAGSLAAVAALHSLR